MTVFTGFLYRPSNNIELKRIFVNKQKCATNRPGRGPLEWLPWRLKVIPSLPPPHCWRPVGKCHAHIWRSTRNTSHCCSLQDKGYKINTHTHTQCTPPPVESKLNSWVSNFNWYFFPTIILNFKISRFFPYTYDCIIAHNFCRNQPWKILTFNYI